MNKTREITIIEKSYLEDLQKIKDTIRDNQNKAMVVVNSAMIMTYYEIGTIIIMPALQTRTLQQSYTTGLRPHN